MNLWSMAKLFECIRYTVLHKGFAYFDKLKDENHSIFMAGTTYRVTDKGNQIKSYTHWGTNYPMFVTVNVVYSGNSSFGFVVDVFEHDSKQLLMSSALTFVYVDFRTRKPAPFPDWYKVAKQNKNFGPPMPRLPTPTILEGAFQFETYSTYSDIDFNAHVNQSIYVKWCTDAGTEAALKGHYSDFDQNIGKYPLKSLELKYIGEGLVGETFVINTWQDPENPLILHFVITKNNKIALVAKMTYWASSFGSKL